VHPILAAVSFARRRAVPVLVVAAILCAAGLAYTAHHLSVNTDTSTLFAKSLPWRQAQIKENLDFPQFNNLIVAVVRAQTPEEADETAAALNQALAADKTNFIDSAFPAGSPFFTHEGLLLLPTADLTKLLTSIIAAQPFLGQLAADPSARGLFTGLGLIAQGVTAGANLTPYSTALCAVAANLKAAAAGHPVPLSWQSLIAAGPGGNGPDFVLAHPHLNQGSLQPGGVATAALVRIAATLPDVKAGRATVNYTGQIPLSDEQFASLTDGLVTGAIISLLLIALWLYLALRSWRLILPILVTLVAGLAFTMSFAAIFIGRINLISVAFAILFIGLAVDFAIQFCVRLRDVRHGAPGYDKARHGAPDYADARHAEPGLGAALDVTAREAGGQIALAAAATACGFLAFSPTNFVGVAELGTIAGVGMFIAFLCTIIILPAQLALLNPRADTAAIGLPFGRQADAAIHRHSRNILAVFAVFALIGLYSAATLGFDANPLDTKDPSVPSMRTLNKLLKDPETNPFYADALTPNIKAAAALAAKFSALPKVDGAVSGATFVPADQDQKLAMLAQVQNILAPTILASQTPNTTPVTAADIRTAMGKAHDQIMAVAGQLPKGSPLLSIAASAATLQSQSDAQIMAANAAITRFLPAELARLAASITPSPITRQSLPPDIASQWFLPDGQVRVEAFPTAAAQTTAGLRAFADAVVAVAPNAGGPAISTIATAGTILQSFREAALLATIAIAVILLIVFRNLRDAGLVLAALLMSALLTALFARLAGLSINYANIIALPLLLGVGVSFNVYFVMNFRAGLRNFLQSATAHAVLFSALTTGTAFGTLAASHDRGTASMGILLLLSLAAVLISTFGFLPALLIYLGNVREA
jgi:hopanoid biosynthesis associated RND transporter like protein HpnN